MTQEPSLESAAAEQEISLGRELRRARDVTWAGDDPWPFLLMMINTYRIVALALLRRHAGARHHQVEVRRVRECGAQHPLDRRVERLDSLDGPGGALVGRHHRGAARRAEGGGAAPRPPGPTPAGLT